MVRYSNSGQKTGLKKVCLWSKMSGICMVHQVTWLKYQTPVLYILRNAIFDNFWPPPPPPLWCLYVLGFMLWHVPKTTLLTPPSRYVIYKCSLNGIFQIGCFITYSGIPKPDMTEFQKVKNCVNWFSIGWDYLGICSTHFRSLWYQPFKNQTQISSFWMEGTKCQKN